MTIVCGTDFSDRAAAVAGLAAQMARRLDQPLSLVHVLSTRGVMINVATVLEAVERAARERIRVEAERLRGLGAQVDTVIAEGWPDEGLLHSARERDAQLIVLSALGKRHDTGVALGKTCERVLLRSSAPTLVVRDPDPIRRWLAGERPLKVLCGFDFTESSAAAIAWSRRLVPLGACDLVAAYVDDPAREAARLGLRSGESREQAQRIVEAELRERLRRIFAKDSVPLVVAPHLGDPAARLAHLAEEQQADLVLVGTHQRHGVSRVAHRSVSLDLVRHTGASVLVVPAAAETAPYASAAQRVLIATDLSPNGNRAAVRALAMAAPGTRVRLLTVIHPLQMPTAAFGRAISDPAARAEFEVWKTQCQRDLLALVPGELAGKGLAVDAEVIEHESAVEAIREAAERIDADLVCMGTAGRTGLAATLMGSVAQGVLKHSQRPVLLVPIRGD